MKRLGWLLLAVVLLVAAAWLMRGGESVDTGPKRTDVHLPRRATPDDVKRMHRRRTLLPRKPASPDAPPIVEVQDPVLRALPPRGPGDDAVVVELNAIRHSPAAEMFLRCMDEDAKQKLQELRDKFGVDPLQDLDRFVLGPNETVLVSGDFADFDTSALDGLKSQASYGDQGTLLEYADGQYAATWNDEMVIFADSLEEAQGALDRLEGRTPVTESALPESAAYGEAYGYVGPELLARMLPPRDGLEEQLLAAAQDIELHLDTRSDVGAVFDVRGDDPAAVEELGVMIGAALSVARIKARTDGDDELSQLLDMAKVIPDGDRFRLEMAVPLDYLRKQLGACAEPPAAP
ncbi:MAG: hypothetical protein RMA76_09355 [Deltaproteobacteria bacterium]|jgi:hypothetical protein